MATLVPVEHLANVGKTFTEQTGRCADTWTDSDLQYARAMLPTKYHSVPCDWLKIKWINMRKSGKYGMNTGGTGPRQYVEVEAKGSDEYRQWISSLEFQKLADQVKENAEYRCQVCNAQKANGTPLHAHHRDYKRMKTSEEILDLVCLCRRCHFAYHDKVENLPDDTLLF